MPTLNTYVRGEWTVGTADAEIGSLTAPSQITYGVPVVDKRGALAVTTSLKIYDTTATPADAAWVAAFIESDLDLVVLTRSGGSDANSSTIIVKAGTRIPLHSNQTTNYSATLATRLANVPAAIDQVWIRNNSATTAANYRFVYFV